MIDVDDKVFRHLKRTPAMEFLENWKLKSIYLPANYIPEFLEFARYCEENHWTFTEGAVVFAEEDIKNRQEKIEADKEKIKNFK